MMDMAGIVALMVGAPPVLKDHHPAVAQAAPKYYRPVWHVNHLVYQAGCPILKRSSMTGGGFLPMKDFAGHEAPGWQPYATPVSSQIGGGQLPSRVNFLTLLGGNQETTQF